MSKPSFIPVYILQEGIRVLGEKHPNLAYDQKERIVTDVLYATAAMIVEANKEK